MKLTEVLGTQPRYYHGSKKQFPVGFVLRPQSDGYVQAGYGDEFDEIIERIEEILEFYRPRSVISRKAAVFLVDQPDPDLIEYAGGYTDFIYNVEPIGMVWKTNLYWYSQIYSIAEGMSPNADIAGFRGLKKLSQNYWQAVPSGRDLNEYLCATAKIVQLIRL